MLPSTMTDVFPIQPHSLFEHERVEKVIKAVLRSYIGDHTDGDAKDNADVKNTGSAAANNGIDPRTTSINDVQNTNSARREKFVAYDGRQSAQLCVVLADQIRNKVKQLNYERYKIVCLTQIFENKNQGISSIARLLCDSCRDRYALVRKELTPISKGIGAGAGAYINEDGDNGNVATAFLVISVFAIYYP